MTTTEALDRLSAEIPGRSFFANKQIGYHHKSTLTSKHDVRYTISVLPGFNGSECQQFTSPDGFDKPVADCLALAKSVAATENNE